MLSFKSSKHNYDFNFWKKNSFDESKLRILKDSLKISLKIILKKEKIDRNDAIS